MRVLGIVILAASVVACGGSSEPALDVPSPKAQHAPGPGSATATDGTEIAFTVTGAGAPALVFIHGWMCDQTFWDAQVTPMREDHTVVTVDLAGHGLSGAKRNDWTLAAFGADVRAVVEHLGLEEVIVVGHSMGGPVALEAARLMPERVIGVVAVDALQNVEFEYDDAQKAAFIAAWEQDFAGNCTGFVRSMFPETVEPALVDRVETSMCVGPAESSVAQLRQFLEYDMKAALAAVQVPVRCINAASWPTNLEGNRTYHADFNAVIIDGPGHFLMMEEPDVFNASLGLVIAEISDPPVN